MRDNSVYRGNEANEQWLSFGTQINCKIVKKKIYKKKKHDVEMTGC